MTAPLNAPKQAWHYLLRQGDIGPVAGAQWPLGALVATVLAYSGVRGAFECIWIDLFADYTWYLSVAHNYPMYGLLLVFAIPTLADAITRRLSRQAFDPKRLRALLNCSVVIWAVAYPIVPIVSMWTGSSFFTKVEIFHYVPGFIVHNNFVPSGMFVAIAIIFWKFPRAIGHIYSCRGWHAWLGFLAATVITYLIYYQWLLHALYVGVAWRPHLGHLPFWTAYSLSMLLYLVPWFERWHQTYPEVPKKVFWIFFAVTGIPLVALPKIGVLEILRVYGLI